jgi:hypothetical protein
VFDQFVAFLFLLPPPPGIFATTHHHSVVMPILVLAQLGTAAEASHAEVKVTADGAAYPDSVGDVLAAWVAVVFNARLCCCWMQVR